MELPVNQRSSLKSSLTDLSILYPLLSEPIRDVVSMVHSLYKGDPITCTIFILAWASNWGSLGFPCNQNNRGSSSEYVTCIYCYLNVKINTRKTLQGMWRSWTHLFCVGFACVVSKDPQFKPHGWRSMSRQSCVYRLPVFCSGKSSQFTHLVQCYIYVSLPLVVQTFHW